MQRTIDLLDNAAGRIGGASARLDAEVLLAHVLGVQRGWLLLNLHEKIDPKHYDLLVERRARGEPVAYITGMREFWSLPLTVTPAVLIPRPDSETLIEAAIASGISPQRILDLGTGSGALLLAALSQWPQATGLGIDASVPALGVALENAIALGMAQRARFKPGFWAEGLAEQFDLILSNPPYIADDEPLSPEVKAHEPHLALFAGPDGLDAYRRILPALAGLLAPGGVAVLEIGHQQAAAVLALAANVCPALSGNVRQDIAGRDRCVVLRAGDQKSRRS
jgi:release factor glutamine methyltransferase